MTDTGQAPGRARSRDYEQQSSTGWVGWIVFAAVMMMMMGGFHALSGLVALFQDDYYVTAPSGLVVNVDYTAWGWTHLILGAVVFLAGLALLAGQMWARVVGVLLAALSAFVNMVFLPAYPLWSIVIITVDILVIYALTVHGREGRALSS